MALDQNVPNPFNPNTRIRFTLGTPAYTSLEIYDVAGRLVRTLIDRPLQAGTFTEAWNGRDGNDKSLTSGVYFCRLTAGTHVLTRKMLLLR
jgi:flagellar hook assembly protein FlgD